jgi:hypothetical protein
MPPLLPGAVGEPGIELPPVAGDPLPPVVAGAPNPGSSSPPSLQERTERASANRQALGGVDLIGKASVETLRTRLTLAMPIAHAVKSHDRLEGAPGGAPKPCAAAGAQRASMILICLDIRTSPSIGAR